MKAAIEALLTMLRRVLPIAALVLTIGSARGQSGETFDAFLAALWKDAAAQGISRATFDLAFTGVTPDARVLGAMQHAPEYGKPVGAYIEGIVSPARIGGGLRKSAQWADTLRAVEKKYGVPASILVSIWGIESSFGDSPDRWDVIRCIATLAQAKIQNPYFRDELISALQILQSQAIARPQLLGSYAGAMGQAQFMPSSYLKYAVDFDGDGRADIWKSVPDVLASIANYLRQFGWQPGLPWGFEVLAPLKFDYAASRGPFRDWRARGFERLDGGRWPESGDAILFFPSGAPGPAFLVTQNFVVLKTYNNSDAYALAVAHLADRLRGAKPFRSAWPLNDFQPSRAARIALQKKLSSLGYKVADFDGHFDFDLRDDIRKLQLSFGMTPDGHPSRAFLDRLGLHVP
ncbi:MAG TPA: lytic murein transglycosylase [Xanthobacteraceae bacterium]|nr:lytic murein transglycosylase [Xanthobacteraceae bacterium]